MEELARWEWMLLLLLILALAVAELVSVRRAMRRAGDHLRRPAPQDRRGR